MNEKQLSRYDGSIVRITTTDGKAYEGECTHNSAEYCDIEFGRNESSLQIDDFLFYASYIKSVEVIDEKQIYVWDDRPEHLMDLSPQMMAMIEKGTKTIELRLYDGKRQKINIGDIIRFEDAATRDDVLRVIVDDLYIFDSFRELYEKLPLLECGYTEENVKDAKPEDMDVYYSPERQSKYKVVGIRMKLYPDCLDEEETEQHL